jgi:hypothetical protein
VVLSTVRLLSRTMHVPGDTHSYTSDREKKTENNSARSRCSSSSDLPSLPAVSLRITSHQGQGRCDTGAQYADVIRTYDSRIVHHVSVRSVVSHQVHRVAHLQVFETAKETVSVASDSDVAPSFRSSRTPDPPYPAIQGEVIGSIQYRHLEVDSCNPKNCQRRQEMLRETSFVGIDPRLGPQTEVDP